MFNTKKYSIRKYSKLLSILLAVIFAFVGQMPRVYSVSEVPDKAFTGFVDADAIIKNIDYTDVKYSNTWAKEAIYSTGALGVMRGYGDKQFVRTGIISKEQAIAIAYRLAGREADAQKAAEALDNARAQGDKKVNPISMWSDGYLQLAANEGLISSQNLTDAMSTEQGTVDPQGFHKGAAAQRQEIANWIAKALKLQPEYGQQNIFNSYKDWKQSDPIKVPYIEAVLKNKIMSGTGNGYFSPTQSVTREQAAQIIKNAEDIQMPILGFVKYTGVVESVLSAQDQTEGRSIKKNTINIRNADGKLHQIIAQSPIESGLYGKNEITGGNQTGIEKEVVVYKAGNIGKSEVLAKGDRIDYITASDSTVRYVRVLSSEKNNQYIAARVNKVDTGNMTIEATEHFKLDSFDAVPGDNNVLKSIGDQTNKVYRYSDNVAVLINGSKGDITSIKPGMGVLLSVSGNIIAGIKPFDVGSYYVESGIVKGIVEDNNPDLGYITLYNEDGTGTSSQTQQQLAVYRTYNYFDNVNLEVLKNHQKAQIGDIKVGDSVFIKLDSNGNVESLSAVDNFIVKYASVVSKNPTTLSIRYDDGTEQLLTIDEDTLIIKDKKLTRYDSIKDGDRVKILLNVNNKFTSVREISIEGSNHLLANIYKGTMAYIDDASNKIIMQNLEVLNRGLWVKTDGIGFSDIGLADNYSIYSNDKSLDIIRANKYLRDTEAYIAVEKDYGGDEKAVIVSFRNSDDTEVVYSDTVLKAVKGSGEFSLNRDFNSIKSGAGTIVVKDGRLVTLNSISQGDSTYVVANRSYVDGDYYAGVVQIGNRTSIPSGIAQIYRGRIDKINEGVDFTVESFSLLDGQTWNYGNTPKTFKITNSTRILDESGVVSQRDFIGYGEDTFVEQVVYVVEKDGNALLISTAPYGARAVKGDITELIGMTIGESGDILGAPTGIAIRNVSQYDTTDFLWDDIDNLEMSLLKNSIIIKGNSIISPEQLKVKDKVRILKKATDTSTDAYIVFVEN